VPLGAVGGCYSFFGCCLVLALLLARSLADAAADSLYTRPFFMGRRLRRNYCDPWISCDRGQLVYLCSIVRNIGRLTRGRRAKIFLQQKRMKQLRKSPYLAPVLGNRSAIVLTRRAAAAL